MRGIFGGGGQGARLLTLSRMSSAWMFSVIWAKWALSSYKVAGAAGPHFSQGAIIFLARLMGMAKPMP